MPIVADFAVSRKAKAGSPTCMDAAISRKRIDAGGPLPPAILDMRVHNPEGARDSGMIPLSPPQVTGTRHAHVTERRNKMKVSTKDRIQGKYHEAKGAIKEKVGATTGNPVQESRGHDEKVAGKLLNKVGQVEKELEK